MLPMTESRLTDARWLALLCLSRMSFSLIFTVYSGILPLVREAWGMSSTQAGLIQSAWHLGFLVSLFAAGMISDRKGARWTFLHMSYGAVASAALFALLADGFLSALILYGLAGLCSGGSYTPGLTLISERFEPHRRGRAMGFYLAAASLGYALSLFLGSFIAPTAGWRAALAASAAGTLLGLALGAWVLRDTPNRVSRHDRAPAQSNALLEVWRNRPARLIILAYSFHAWELLGLWAWLPTFLVSAMAVDGSVRPGNMGVGVLIAGLCHLLSVAGSVFGGTLSDRYGRTAVILLFAGTSAACSLIYGWLITAPLWLLTAVAIVYNLAAIADSSVFSTGLTELVPHRYIGAAYSLRSVIGFGMGAASPWVFGLTLDLAGEQPGEPRVLAWGLAFSTLGVAGLAATYFTWRLRCAVESQPLAGGLR
jgi:MFS family permease